MRGSTDRPTGSLLSPARIDDLLNYQLSRLTAFAGSAVIRLCEGKYGISRREWHILALLGGHGPRAPSELADMTHLDRARVSRALALLREKGLVNRIARPGDHRRAVVELTASGQHLYKDLFAEVAKINIALVSALDPPVLGALQLALDKLQARAREIATDAVQDVHADRWKGVGQRARWMHDESDDDA
jgi:DNA-binding MarR family transcriptional regulator